MHNGKVMNFYICTDMTVEIKTEIPELTVMKSEGESPPEPIFPYLGVIGEAALRFV